MARRRQTGVPGGALIAAAAITVGQSCDTATQPDETGLVGAWREQAQIECGTGALVQPEPRPIGELVFWEKGRPFTGAIGRFAVTWMPFEFYHDYWGSYTADPTTGDLVLRAEQGNRFPPVPTDFDGVGAYAIDEGGSRLSLLGIWLGTIDPDSPPSSPRCGHVFER